MGKLYDESIFGRRDEAAKQRERSNNRLFIIVVVIAVLAIVAIAAWRWWNNPERKIININTATYEELQYLPHVGPSTARSIISARPFKAPEDLKKVSGIGEKTFEVMKPRVKVE